MRFARWGLVMVAVAAGVLASARWTIQAQDRRKPVAPAPGPNPASLQDAMLRPLDLPFGEETSIEGVRQYLSKALGATVVIDRSALDRLDLTPEDTVQLDLKGVRLKVGLKLLLDQVDLSFHVVPEDNLLILTDSSDDPARRVLSELKAMHREIHDIQDTVDDLADLVEEELGIEPEKVKRRSTPVRHGRNPSASLSPRERAGVRGVSGRSANSRAASPATGEAKALTPGPSPRGRGEEDRRPSPLMDGEKNEGGSTPGVRG